MSDRLFTHSKLISSSTFFLNTYEGILGLTQKQGWRSSNTCSMMNSFITLTNVFWPAAFIRVIKGHSLKCASQIIKLKFILHVLLKRPRYTPVILHATWKKAKLSHKEESLSPPFWDWFL